MVFDSSRPGYLRIPQRSPGSHEERVDDVPRICEDDSVEVEQPRSPAGNDRQIRRVQGRVRDRLLKDDGEVMLEVV